MAAPACSTRPRPHLSAQKGLALQQAAKVAVARNALRPVVRQEDVQRLGQAHQAVHLQLAHVVRAAHAARVVRRPLKVALRCQGKRKHGEHCRAWTHRKLHMLSMSQGLRISLPVLGIPPTLPTRR